MQALESPSPGASLLSVAEAVEALAAETAVGFRFHDSSGSALELRFDELYRSAVARAAWLRSRGARPRDRILLTLLEEEEMVVSFLGAILGGMVPVLTNPQTTHRNLDRFRRRIAHVASTAGAVAIVGSSDLVPELEPLLGSCSELRAVLDCADARDHHGSASPVAAPAALDDPCFLQFTSGSTDLPKGVIITHRNALTNAGACVDAIYQHLGPEPRAVSWLPLYHDFGLIGFLLGPVLYRGPVEFFAPALFARRPALWLKLIHEHRAAVTGAPPFALSYTMRRLQNHDLGQYDLSCLRVLFCGAEPIPPRTLTAFAEWLRPTGFDPDCFLPCYGMAESTLASTLRPARTALYIDQVNAASLRSGRAQPFRESEGTAVDLVSCGTALPGHQLRIVSERGDPLGDRQVGEIQVRGPSVSPGYVGSERVESSRDWLETGDLGYTVAGELFVCGRSKELIIVRGKNFFPHDIEWTVGLIPPLDGRRRVAAFGVEGPDGEQVVVVAEASTLDVEAASDLRLSIRDAVTREHGIVPADVLLVVPGTIPTTSTGKIQRHLLRGWYQAGNLGGRTGPPGMTRGADVRS